MSAARKVFVQSMMISTGILFLNGILAMADHFLGKGEEIVIRWYHPMTIILTGFLCALPTLLLRNRDQWDRKTFWCRIILHGLALYAVVIGMGWLLNWYSDVEGFAGVSMVFFLVYAFVWIASHWLDKRDEKSINQALEHIRDRE
ncbi:MAG: DUF3021 domain-containing protein [Clostridia bacterium]|nr:DUF3021 domain-containing protein [Clostridia bacterium]